MDYTLLLCATIVAINAVMQGYGFMSATFTNELMPKRCLDGLNNATYSNGDILSNDEFYSLKLWDQEYS